MLTHSFYGAKHLSSLRLRPENKPIKTLGELFYVLLFCWSKETADQTQNEAWNRANVTAGQSDVSSMLVFDMFGGSIHKSEIDGKAHYFNKINGNVIDITREQYEIAKIPVSYDESEEISRAELASDEEREKRYKLLLKRISEYLS